jgi:hypothetical protein
MSHKDLTYFRITYKSKNHGYWEDIVPDDEEQKVWMYSLVLRCRKEGVLLVTDQSVVGFLDTLKQGDECPPIFKSEPILHVHLEICTVTDINEFN